VLALPVTVALTHAGPTHRTFGPTLSRTARDPDRYVRPVAAGAERARPGSDRARVARTARSSRASNPITFAHPTMVSINGDGFELDLRSDPATPSTIYAAAPGASSANTSWIWKTIDGGKTWRWVEAAAPYNGKVQSTTPSCLGGGDTELAIDPHHHLYLNDLSGAVAVPLEFSTGRSDDGGATFVCDTAGVPDAGVDRQWYAITGDPTLNGGDQVDQNTLYLANDHLSPGTGACTGVGNVLVMYRSPVPAAVGVPTPNPDAGRTFGPHFAISCDEGIMGNDEVSPVATKRAEDGTLTLGTPVHHVFVAHDNAVLNKISVGRCFPVPFGAPVANTSDPSGLRCVDKLVANLSGTTGANFPTTAIDVAGNVYVVWEETAATNRTLLRYAYSGDEGETWSAPITLPTNAPGNLVNGKQLGGPLNTNVFGWPAAGADGSLDVAWYGSNATGATPDVADGYYSLWLTQSLNANDPAGPTFTDPVLASEHFIHKGTFNTLIGKQTGDRALGDFLQLRLGPQGEAMISYADSNNLHHGDTPHGMFARQIGGPSLLPSNPPVSIAGLRPNDSVTDPTGDALYQAASTSSSNIPNLDITGSSIAYVGPGSTPAAACPSTAVDGCYRVETDLQNMSLSAPPAPDSDQDVRWLTEWLVPSTSEVLGGKNLFVYAESFQGAALQCFTGENGEFSQFFSITYPGTTQITNPASCAATTGPGGNVVVTVPLSLLVPVAGRIDSVLHEVRAATLTQAQPANSDPTGLFNEIDGAQTYDTFPPVPTAVAVTGATARLRGGAVVVTWRTASETDTLGFNLFRRIGRGPFRRVNRSLIVARHAGQPLGATYRRVDGHVRRGTSYGYRLQLVRRNGSPAWFPVGTP
jgi:hypothetical protein